MMGRIYLGAPSNSIIPRFRGVPVFGPFGAAATAGKLLKLNEDQLTSALAYGANFASGLTECWIAGTMEGFFHGGMAARNGMMAANLAKLGAIASEITLEGNRGFYQAFAGTTEEVNNALLGLGKRYLTMEVTYKPYPVCALEQIPIEMVLRLVEKHRIVAKEIKQVVQTVEDSDTKFPGADNPGPFQNGDQTLLSAQFCAAAAFLGKPVKSHSFYMENYNDPAIVALARKVKLIGEKDRKVPKIAVTLHNGKSYDIEEEKEWGTLTPTDEKVRAKFSELATDFLGERKAKEVIDIVMSLEKVDNIKELTRRLASK
jgi:2-methylcitrate dehydratase PrpD